MCVSRKEEEGSLHAGGVCLFGVAEKESWRREERDGKMVWEGEKVREEGKERGKGRE